MNWEGFLGNYDTIENFGENREKSLEILEKRKEELREKVNKVATIRKVKEGTYLSVGAIDSAYGELTGDNWGRRLYAVCVAGMGFIPNGFIEKEPELLTEELTLSYEEEDDYNRILKGLAFAMEINSAKEWFSNMDLMLIDGAAKSIIIAINQATTFKTLENSVSGRKLKSVYKETLEALYDMLEIGKLVFAPKRSSEVLIAEKVSSPIRNDYALLEAILEEGEYIVMDIKEVQNWSYTLPKIEDVSESLLKRLFRLLENLKVIYFKSLSGISIKLETYIPLSVNALWDFFILEGENIFTLLNDRGAKYYFGLMKKYADENNPWKYRM